jgi:hypothetical protein
MECDYTHLNHNSLLSQKNGNQGNDYKTGLLYLKKHGILLPKCKGVFAKGTTVTKKGKVNTTPRLLS